MSVDLIHPCVRNAFRELSVKWGVLREIKEAFEFAGFEIGPIPCERGERRRLFRAYADVIDWKDYGQVSRVIHVFQDILSWVLKDPSNEAKDELSRLQRVLGQYGGLVLEDGSRLRLVYDYQKVELPLESLRDPASIREHLSRLDPADPPLALSSAKSLVEATCKHVLEELGISYGDKDNIHTLVKSVQKGLRVHPDTISETKKGRDTIVRILSSLTQVAVGIAELRNEYGIDHGRTRASFSFTQRHARLAIGAAHTYCCFLLDTLKKHQGKSD